MPDKIVCFIHSCTMNNNTKILKDLLDYIVKTKCIDLLDNIIVNNIGDEIYLSYNPSNEIIIGMDLSKNNENSKIKIINCSKDKELYELATLNLLYSSLQYDKDNNYKILYLHTKGVTRGNNPRINDWKYCMLYFLVENAQHCIALLDKYDTIGINHSLQPYPHYSGNFWWARSSYILTLKMLIPYEKNSSNKMKCEWWILTNPNANFLVLHRSQKNHYMSLYPRTKYDTIQTKDMFKSLIESLNVPS